MKTAVVIPARYGSTRFPGKPLEDVAGRSLIRRVHEIAAAAEGVDRVIVATDDERIRDHVLAFGGEAVRTAAKVVGRLTGWAMTSSVRKAIQADLADLAVAAEARA